jgi:hypothetical protein
MLPFCGLAEFVYSHLELSLAVIISPSSGNFGA